MSLVCPSVQGATVHKPRSRAATTSKNRKSCFVFPSKSLPPDAILFGRKPSGTQSLTCHYEVLRSAVQLRLFVFFH